ncbi:MAG: polysaccharide deacetylase family protein [Pseudomonadota bacterium]
MRWSRDVRFGRDLILASLVWLAAASSAHACIGVKRTITLDGNKTFYGAGNSGNMGLRDKEVVLTFDDGPSPYVTRRVLAALERECTKATFFVVGRMARAYPKTLRAVARAGHTIAHHSYSHGNLVRKGLDRAAWDVERGFQTVQRALGPEAHRGTRLFRYPYLSRNSRLDRVVQRQGLVPVSASVMSQDWKRGTGDDVVARVMRQLNRNRRGVILMHDIQRRTADAVPKLLRRLRREGYSIVHIKGARAPKTLRDSSALVAQLMGKRRSLVARASKPKPMKPRRRIAMIAKRHQDQLLASANVTPNPAGAEPSVSAARAPLPTAGFNIASLRPAPSVNAVRTVDKQPAPSPKVSRSAVPKVVEEQTAGIDTLATASLVSASQTPGSIGNIVAGGIERSRVEPVGAVSAAPVPTSPLAVARVPVVPAPANPVPVVPVPAAPIQKETVVAVADVQPESNRSSSTPPSTVASVYQDAILSALNGTTRQRASVTLVRAASKPVTQTAGLDQTDKRPATSHPATSMEYSTQKNAPMTALAKLQEPASAPVPPKTAPIMPETMGDDSVADDPVAVSSRSNRPAPNAAPKTQQATKQATKPKVSPFRRWIYRLREKRNSQRSHEPSNESAGLEAPTQIGMITNRQAD